MTAVSYKLWRTRLSEDNTLGTLTGPGLIPALYTMEDTVREVPGAPVSDWKIPGKTAIPAGRYRLRWTMSNRFRRMMLLLEGVQGFAGIRIHAGNSEVDTEGCILLGVGRVFDDRNHCRLAGSRMAVEAFEAVVVPQILDAIEVYLEVE